MGSHQRPCSACGESLDERKDGVELWGILFCARCFISHSAQTHRELKPEDIELIRRIGKEMAGLLPGDIVEMILVGFYQRATGTKGAPPQAELARCAGEFQRITALACFRRVLNLLRTWQDTFTEFVEGTEREIRSDIKRLTDLE
jgi:hypothetical protein